MADDLLLDAAARSRRYLDSLEERSVRPLPAGIESLTRFDEPLSDEPRDAAETLRGTWLVVDSGDIPPSADPDEYHDQELIGLAVVTTGGADVGEVAGVLHHGQDLLVVRGPDGETLVPFVAALVPEVDVAGGRLVIDPPPGLLDGS